MAIAVATIVLLFGSITARAAEPSPDTAAQLVGLFVQGCMPFSGDAGSLRSWAAKNGLPELPDQAKVAFLHGAPGHVFDASAPGTKLVLMSSDDGICSTATDAASTSAVAQALEAGLAKAGATFRLAIDRDDKQAKDLHFREYLATRNGRGWRILAATVNDPIGGKAMLTAGPE